MREALNNLQDQSLNLASATSIPLHEYIALCLTDKKAYNFSAFESLIYRLQDELVNRCPLITPIGVLPVKQLFTNLPAPPKGHVFTERNFISITAHLLYLMMSSSLQVPGLMTRDFGEDFEKEVQAMINAFGLESTGLFKWRAIRPNSQFDDIIKSAGFDTSNFLTSKWQNNTMGQINDELKEVHTIQDEVLKTEVQIKELLVKSVSWKPVDFVISDLNWKFLFRNVLRNTNVLIRGAAGSGKSTLARLIAEKLNRPFFSFNLGATQDPKTFLFGVMQFEAGKGTVHLESEFIKAIRTPNAVVLLDEITRAHPEANNILMSVLEIDKDVRKLRIDDQGNKEIKVDPGVCFIATANVGVEYTGTRQLDRAIEDRFVISEMEIMTQQYEAAYLKSLYPTVDDQSIMAITKVAAMIRTELKSDIPKLSRAISTRTMINWAGHLNDGFSLEEATTLLIANLFSEEGGVDSERTYFWQLFQRYAPAQLSTSKLFNK